MQKQYLYENALLIQFAKAPVAGEVKTRLISELGKQGACRVHKLLTEKVMRNLVSGGLAKSYLYSNNPESVELQSIVNTVCQQFKTQMPIKKQVGANLGQRMAQAFSNHLLFNQNINEAESQEADRKPIVVLVGSDCPALDADYLQQAIIALDDKSELTADVVIGPADDGGYVLIAMNKAYLSLFDDIEWGSDKVLAQTVDAVKKLDLRLTLLDSLPDIDRPEDLYLLHCDGLGA